MGRKMKQDELPGRAMRWVGAGLIGIVGGLLLGQITVGSDADLSPDSSVSYAAASGNPDALTVDSHIPTPCYGCDDGYAVAARLDALRGERMGDEFRELGAVDVDTAAQPDSDYHYGGRFPDPESTETAEPVIAMVLPIAIPAPAGPAPAPPAVIAPAAPDAAATVPPAE